MKLIIDSSALCYRSFFTIKDLSYEQRKVGVIFGFIKQIFSLAQKFNTSEFIFCFDSKQSYRSLVYPSYKSNRKKDMTEQERSEMEQAYGQFDEIRETLLPLMGFKNIFRQNGYEADDLVAWCVARFPDDYIIVSQDNDLLQLIQSTRFVSIKWYNFKAITDEAEFTKNWFGLKPKHWALVKAIAGCSGDGVVGIAGVGEITAAKYIAGLLKGKSLEKIESDEGKELAEMNYQLVSLPFNGVKPINILELKEDEISLSAFKCILGQYGFRSLLKDEEIEKWKKSFRLED
jgi:5'-3' exonuclease